MEKFVASPINEDQIQDKEATIEEYIECINNNISILERCNRDWAMLLKEVRGERKVSKEEEDV